MTDPEKWLEENAIHCYRFNGRWSRQRCADLSGTTDLCHKCRRRPKTLRPSPAANEIKRLVEQHAFTRWGVRGACNDPRPDVSMETFE